MCAVTPALVCMVAGVSCQAPTRPPVGGEASIVKSAGRDDGFDHWTTAAARLRAAAMSVPAEAVIVTRPDLVMDQVDVDVVDAPAESSLDFGAAIAMVDEVARRRIDLAIATTNPAPESGRPSREATRLYLLGRTAIADSRPGEAIVPLERSSRSGGGVAALRALAEACDRAGRPAKAIEARLELARRGSLDLDERAMLVEGLWRRGRRSTALAVQSAGVVAAIEGDELAIEAWRLSVLLESLGAAGEAAGIREALSVILSMDDAEERLRRPVPRELQRLRVALGDDAMSRGRVQAAADEWRRADELVPGSAAIRSRRLRAEAALGRDLVVESILLDAATSPTDEELELAGVLRTAGVSFDRIGPILEAMVAETGTTEGAWRLLVAVDPARGGTALDRLVEGDRQAVAGMLVEAAFESGTEAAIEMACSFGDSIDGVDVVVDALLEGPADAESLLSSAISITPSTTGLTVLAELLRRHDRIDLAWGLLPEASGDDDVARIVRLRVAGDAVDPQLVLGVPDRPFSMAVECERVASLMAAGEPELAWETASRLLERAPDDPRVLVAAGRAAFARRGGEVEAAELVSRARRAGDDSIETMLLLSGIVGALPGPEGLSPGAARTLSTFGDDPRFRAIYEVDAAMVAGDGSSSIPDLERMLVDRELREAVLVRLLAAWRTAGRLAEGRLRLTRLVERYPADPVLGDALFAVEQAIRGPRAVAIELRPRAGKDVGGQPLRRLELALADIPESRSEWRRIAGRRLDRRPDGAAVRIERLANALETPGPELDAAMAEVGSMEFASLAPRQRRRLASVAAAVPEGRGADLIEALLELDGQGPVELDVDTAVAAAATLPAERVESLFDSARPMAPWTRVDPSWQGQVSLLAGRDPVAADLVAKFGLKRPPLDSESAGLVRTATAIALLVGWEPFTILDRLDRAAAVGWKVAEAWPDGEAWDRRRLGAIASDASMLGREALAIEIMELAVDERPDDPVMLNNLAYALLEDGKLERAAVLLEESRRLDPDSASTLDSIGWLRFFEGRHDPADPESAVSLVRRSISIRLEEGRVPSSEVLMHLADTTWAAGDGVEAERLWRSLARVEDDADRRRRLAGIAGYQMEVWGAELVPSESIDHLLEGRWHDAARARIEALEAGRDPLSTIAGYRDPDS